MPAKSSLALLTALLCACSQVPVSPPDPDPALPSSLIQVDFTGVDSSHPTSNLKVFPSQEGIRKQQLLEVGGLSFSHQGTETFTDPIEGVRYLQAHYRVTNHNQTPLDALGFLPVVLKDEDGTFNNRAQPTVPGTPYSKVLYYDGSDASSLASTLQPTFARRFDLDTGRLENVTTRSVLVSGLFVDGFHPTPPGGLVVDEVKPHAWKFRHPLLPGQSRVMTFSVKIPIPQDPRGVPYSFSLVAAITNHVPNEGLLGTDLDIDTSDPVYHLDMVLNHLDQPTVAWVEKRGARNVVYVKHWNDTRWEQLGGEVGEGMLDDSRVDLAVDPLGRPVVVYADGRRTFVKRFNGTTWEQIGGPVAENASSYLPQQAVVADGEKIIVAYYEESVRPNRHLHVKMWNGEAWETIDSSTNSYVTTRDRPVLKSSGRGVFLAHSAHEMYHDNADWPGLSCVVKVWNGFSWKQLGKGLNASVYDNGSCDLTIGKDGWPVVGLWHEDSNSWAERWNGLNWERIPGDVPGYAPQVRVDRNGQLWMLVWSKANSRAEVWTYVDGWVKHGQYTQNLPAGTYLPRSAAFELDHGSIPVVAWIENQNAYVMQ